MATDALSSDEWLEAARLSLGLDEADDLRLVEVIGKVAANEGDLEGFLGETLPVKVRVKLGEDGEEKEAALFLKMVPSDNPTRQALCGDTRAFEKETAFFELVARLGARTSADLTLQPWGARCFVNQPHALLFEDLSVQGFQTVGVRSTLDFAHCAAALDTIARLHANSLVVEESDRRSRGFNPWRLGDRFREPLMEIIFTETFSNLLSKYFVSGIAAMKTIVSLMPKYKNSPRYKEILQKLDKLPKVAYEVVKPSKKYRNVICHGDIWVNNIMFRKTSWGQVAEARLVDFQITRYTPPAYDVEMLFQLGTRRAIRDAHAAELRDVYYQALEKALAAAGLRADKLVPRAEFDESCRLAGVFARIVPATYFPGDLLPTEVLRRLLASEEDYLRFLTEDRSPYVRDAWDNDAEYKERLSETMTELVDNLLLDKDGPF